MRLGGYESAGGLSMDAALLRSAAVEVPGGRPLGPYASTDSPPKVARADFDLAHARRGA